VVEDEETDAAIHGAAHPAGTWRRKRPLNDPAVQPTPGRDNTGARTIQCIRIMGRSRQDNCGVGDVIIASVKQAIPNAGVKKGDVVRGRRRPHGQGIRPAGRELQSASTRMPPS